MHYYKIHHLILFSSIKLPELVCTEPQPADVQITEGEVPLHLPQSKPVTKGNLFNGEIICEIQDDSILLVIRSVGRILIQGTCSIIVHRDDPFDLDTMRTYLLGTGFGFLLMKQRIFPLHGSTVNTPYGAAMFVGHSGWGKSTTAAKFLQHGHTLISDDVCVVHITDKGIPMVHPSSHRLKLWEDSIGVLGYDPISFTAIMPDWDKKQTFVSQQLSKASQPLLAIYQLWPDLVEEVKLISLLSHEKLATISSNTFRVEAIELLNLTKDHFLFCSSLARIVTVKRLSRPIASFNINDLYQLVLDDLESIFEAQLSL